MSSTKRIMLSDGDLLAVAFARKLLQEERDRQKRRLRDACTQTKPSAHHTPPSRGKTVSRGTQTDIIDESSKESSSMMSVPPSKPVYPARRNDSAEEKRKQLEKLFGSPLSDLSSSDEE